MAHLTLIFTDLDGSLLDHDTYSFRPAVPALQRLAADDVPVIPTTSKTAAEVLALNEQMGQTWAFIFENGSGIGAPLFHTPPGGPFDDDSGRG